MSDSPPETIKFKHARFSTRLPVTHTYTPSHFWLARAEDTPHRWRVGFTKFATRMLGELVECEFKVDVGGAIEPGQVIGHVEGFKAISDLFSVADGAFAGGNPEIEADACIIRNNPYKNWLYQIDGEPEPDALDVHGYLELLTGTITSMHEQEKRGEATWQH
ncbi:MAG: glycine cleavage system protein H [Verrucomicrobiota bacterium]